MKRNLIFFVFFTLFLFFSSQVDNCYARIAVIGNLTHQKEVKLEESYSGVIFVKNLEQKPTEVRVYQNDYLSFFDGRSIYGKPGEDKRSNAKWIEFKPDRVVIQPGVTAEVNYTVKVPKNESLRGDYWSIIMIEDGGEPTSFSDLKKNQVGIKQVVRYAVQIITKIDSKLSKVEFKFLKVGTQLLKEEKKFVLFTDMENNGEELLIPNVYAELYDNSGRFLGKFDSGPARIYPGCSARKVMDLTGVPDGEYKAVVIADAGGDNIFGANIKVTIGKEQKKTGK
jgi:hypothetical protein